MGDVREGKNGGGRGAQRETRGEERRYAGGVGGRGAGGMEEWWSGVLCGRAEVHMEL